MAWGGSRSSLAEADALAWATAERIVARIRRGEGFPERYSYGERPLREEILEEFPGAADETALSAAITRNSYGVLVLNTARVAFIDVDLPRSRDSVSLGERLLRWLTRRPPPPPTDHAAEARERLREWLDQHPAWSVRIYRTRSGLRYLLTHATFSPENMDFHAAMEFLGADPQYRRLCRAQKSFRARLTPKPWRIGIGPPPHRFPWGTSQEEQEVRAWQARYEQAAQGYATCRFVEALGSREIHPEVEPFLRLHDSHTRSESDLPLA